MTPPRSSSATTTVGNIMQLQQQQLVVVMGEGKSRKRRRRRHPSSSSSSVLVVVTAAATLLLSTTAEVLAFQTALQPHQGHGKLLGRQLLVLGRQHHNRQQQEYCKQGYNYPFQSSSSTSPHSPAPYHISSRRLNAAAHFTTPGLGAATSAATAAAAVPHVRVSLDQTLLPRDSRLGPLFKLLAFLTSKSLIRFAAISLCAALLVSLLMKASSSGSAYADEEDEEEGYGGGIKGLGGTIVSVFRSTFERIQDTIRNRLGGASAVEGGTPMSFDDNDENEGWGVCTLRSKRRLGTTSFVRYDFELPDPKHVLPIKLGQQIELCCLDNSNTVAKGKFFTYHEKRRIQPGSFSILTPNNAEQNIDYGVNDIDNNNGSSSSSSSSVTSTTSSSSTNTNTKGHYKDKTANFVRVLRTDLRVGDEVAIKPGKMKLDYKGQYLPVTDMVYLAYGVGIVPVLEQTRSVLPNGASSVKTVSVAWINDNTRDFDVNADLLEKEYIKYKSKMAVSCISEDVSKLQYLADSMEINSSIPDFKSGTMAVIAGPKSFADKAMEFLEDRGYPIDTICVL